MAKSVELNMKPLDELFCDKNELQKYLQKAFDERNIGSFRHGLRHECADVARIQPDQSVSLFQKCCWTKGYAKLIQLCLEWANDFDKLPEMNMANERYEMSPIHFVLASGDVKNLRALLQCPSIDIDVARNFMTPLHQQIIEMNNANFFEHLESIKLLLSHGADVNVPNSFNVPPVLTVVNNDGTTEKQKREVLEYMFKSCIVDLDAFNDGEARRVIEKRFPDLVLPDIVLDTDRRWTEDMLFDALRTKDEEDHFRFGFCLFRRTQSKEILQSLLNHKVQNKSLLSMAILEGMIGAVELLLRSGADVHDFSSTENGPVKNACKMGRHDILSMLMRSSRFDVNRTAVLFDVVFDPRRMPNISDYNRCFDILIEHKQIDLSMRNDHGSTVLHTAVANNHKYVINQLLRKNAYIGARNNFDDIAIENIDAELLENHFDSCIVGNGQRIDGNGFQLVFDYSNLKPSEYEKHKGPFDEMVAIEYIAKTKEYQHLIKHPLIASVLDLKWERVKKAFYINAVLFFLFGVALVSYVFFYFGKSDSGIICEVLYVISIAGAMYVLLRELVQFLLFPSKYVTQCENYFELALVLVSGLVVSGYPFDDVTRRSIGVCAILLVFGELFHLTGSLPVLSLTTHLVMLRTVFYTILDYLRLYSIMLFAFALCFMILFQDADNESEFNTFTDFGVSMVKVLMMMTGEVDAGSITITSFFGYFILTTYVLLFSVSMFNLLTGLAVSDSQMIKDEAEMTYFIYRSEIVAKYEQSSLRRADYSRWYHMFTSCDMNLFSEYLPMNKVHVMVHQKRRVFIPSEATPIIDADEERKNSNCCSRFLAGVFSNVYMSKAITKYGLLILNKKPDEDEHAAPSALLDAHIMELKRDVLSMKEQLEKVLARKR